MSNGSPTRSGSRSRSPCLLTAPSECARSSSTASNLANTTSLTPDQWATPSLCAGWSVRDVVAHILSYEELG
ncbi:MAG: maleylpyruvate isomerase N-terminal domain-containing protein [Acidimicrobiia bacterium]